MIGDSVLSIGALTLNLRENLCICVVPVVLVVPVSLPRAAHRSAPTARSAVNVDWTANAHNPGSGVLPVAFGTVRAGPLSYPGADWGRPGAPHVTFRSDLAGRRLHRGAARGPPSCEASCDHGARSGPPWARRPAAGSRGVGS